MTKKYGDYIMVTMTDDTFDVFSVRDDDGNNLFESIKYREAYDYLVNNADAVYVEGERVDEHGRCYYSTKLASRCYND